MTTSPTMQSLVQMYLEERRSAGFALEIPGKLLMGFASFSDRRGHRGPLTEQLILDWVQGCARRATLFTWARRLQTIRPFARFCFRLDRATYIPEQSIFGRAKRRLTPHIYTGREVADLLRAAGQLTQRGTLRPATYKTLFGLIAATGLRLSEALKLQFADLDFSRGVLTVRQTKFAKSRLVPLHPSVTAALSRYAMFRQVAIPANPKSHFFVGSTGNALAKTTVHWTFQRLRKQLGWKARGSHPFPRIHDLRHTFICSRVQLWHDRGADIDHAMLALATYVGHAKVSDTYWYLTGVPELMAIAGRNFEGFVAPHRRRPSE
jgi:integrase/recombinase XerD